MALAAAVGLPDAVVVIDGDANVVWGNRAAERLFGRSLHESVGMCGLDLIHPDDVALALSSIGTVKGVEVGSPIELRVAANAGWRLVELIGAPCGERIVLSLRDLTERRRWEVASEGDRLRAILQNTPTVMLLTDADGTILTSSAALTRVLGHDQSLVEGRPLTTLVVPAEVAELTDAFGRLREGGPRATVEVGFRAADGATVPMSVQLANLLDDPTTPGVVVTLHDVSDRARANEELRRATSLLAATLDATAEGVLVVDLEGRITNFNSRLVEMFRLDLEFLGIPDGERTLRHVVGHLRDPEEFLARVMDLSRDPGAESHDVVEFGDGRVVERDSRPQRLDGEVIGRVWSFRDITTHRMLQKELARQAFHDPLTGLANSALFRDRVTTAVESLRRNRARLAVLFVDLDDFKTVNDSLGHSVGDELLTTVADRLRNCVRSRDTVARLGGDEFAVLVENLPGERHAREIAARILSVLARPVVVGSHSVVTNASIGIVYGRAGQTADELLRNADLAMYEAKRAGRGRFEIYAPGMHDAALRRLEVDSVLRGAAARGELEVEFQPVVHGGTGRIDLLEALVRWRHPQRGLLLPQDFIPLAEQSAVIDEVGRFVLEAACEQAREWADLCSGEEAPAVSVNLSPRQLLDDRLPADVAGLLQRVGLEPDRLVLEITEGALMLDPEAAITQLHRLRDLGVRLAVDDFGMGYSSLAYLQRFPIHTVKIDRQFVAQVHDRAGTALVRAVVDLARALDLDAVAEGVEDVATLEALTELGCDRMQGYLFARPMDARSARELIAAGSVIRPCSTPDP